MTTALIDGDIVVYRIGWTTENDDPAIACWRANEMVDSILDAVKADEYVIYLTKSNDETAFRKQVYPEYKAQRKQPKPKNYQDIRDYLCVDWNAEIVERIEADDALGIAQDENSVICSIDKDLLQIQGRHYNFVKEEHIYVDNLQGLKSFYTQLITGDTADNIKGIPGSGPVAAKNAIGKLDLEEDLFSTVRDLYGNDEEMLMNGRCLWIWKQEEDDWINHWERLLNQVTDTQ